MPRILAVLIVFVASAAVLVIEILAGRLLAPYIGVTLETFTGIIGTVLAGIALGSWWGGRLADRIDPHSLLGPTLAGGGVLTLATLPIVRVFGPVLASRDPIIIVTLAFLAFFAPATVLSGVTPMVVKARLRNLDETGRTVGWLSAVGTAGALFGTFATGFILLAAFPTPPIVVALGAGLVIAGAGLWLWLPQVSRPPYATLGVAVVLLAVLGIAGDTPCQRETAYFCAAVEPDPAREGGHLLVLDTLRHSYVDVDDPTYLEFDYIKSVVDTIDTAYPGDQPLDALHIGGGGFTLPRYLAETRPGTSSLVLELDPELVDLARDELALETGEDLQVRTGDARLGIQDVPDRSQDVVVGDAFGGLAVPWHLTTVEFLREVQRVLRPGGIYVLNLIDHPPLGFARAEAATLASVFEATALMAPPDRVAGEAGGNFVLVASDAPIDTGGIQETHAARGDRDEVISGDRLRRFASNAQVLTDDFAPVDQLLNPQPRAR